MWYSPPVDAIKSDDRFAIDHWACGVVLYAMLTCSLPFSHSALSASKPLALKIPPHISKGSFSDNPFLTIFRISLPIFLCIGTTGAVDVIAALLNANAVERISVADILISSDFFEQERSSNRPEALATLSIAKKLSTHDTIVHIVHILMSDFSLNRLISFLFISRAPCTHPPCWCCDAHRIFPW